MSEQECKTQEEMDRELFVEKTIEKNRQQRIILSFLQKVREECKEQWPKHHSCVNCIGWESDGGYCIISNLSDLTDSQLTAFIEKVLEE